MKIKIDGTFFRYVDDIELALTLDSVASAFSFSARFNPDNPQHKELFRPLKYPKVEIFDNGNKLMLTGTMTYYDFGSQASRELVKVAGYSLAGVLEDCNIPVSAYPLESIDRSLKEVAEKLFSLFDVRLQIAVEVAQSANSIYKKTVAEPTESVKDYIAKLCAQRNIVLGHNTKGEIVMYRPDSKAAPKYFFEAGNTLKMKFTVNGQQLHDEINVIRQPTVSNPKVSLTDTAKNSNVGAYRPTVSVLSSGEATNTKTAADNKLATELKGLALVLEFDRYIDVVPTDIVEVKNPEIYLYKRTRFMVAGVSIKENNSGTNTTLSLVLPETYTGENPKNIFA